VQRSYDCAVRERELSFLKGLYRDIVPQLRAQLLELASYSYQLINRDQAPVTISGRDCNAIDRGSIISSLRLAFHGALCGRFRGTNA
jgi:hypothetical protein